MSSTPNPRRSRAPWVGLAIGVVLLAAVACFAIFLPDASSGGESSAATAGSASQDPLVLPDKLPGGYTAADQPEAFAGTDAADQADTIAKQQAQIRSYGDKQLASVLDVPAVNRSYADSKLSALFVQAFRAPGGAFAPEQFQDPSLPTQSAVTSQYVRQGDAVCILQFQAAQPTQPGAPAPAPSTTPSFATCQRSGADLTVKVSGQQLSAEALTATLDGIYEELS